MYPNMYPLNAKHVSVQIRWIAVKRGVLRPIQQPKSHAITTEVRLAKHLQLHEVVSSQ